MKKIVIKRLQNPLISLWHRFPSPNYNYFRYPSAILNFCVKEASGEVGIYTSKKTYPKNISVATEIASISVSVVKLLVLPVWGTVSASGLYLMVFSVVGRGRRRRKWVGRAHKLCRRRWDYVEMSSRRPVITTSGFGGFLLPVCICR